MKNFYTLLFLLSALCGLSSCSDKEPIQPTTETSPTNDDNTSLKIDNLDAFNSFSYSLDSLNESFTPIHTRGFFSIIGKDLADQVGRQGGKYLGRWLGAAVGTMAANPALACIGYIGGQQIGGFLGYAAASAIAESLLENSGFYAIGEGDLVLDTDFNILPSNFLSSDPISRSEEIDTRCDSIGYYHNCIMVKINQNKSKYIGIDGVKIDSIYNDVVLYAQEFGIYAEPLSTDGPVKTAMIDFVKECAQLTLNNAKNQESSDQLIDDQCIYLKNKCNFTSDELILYKNFSGKIAQKCSELSGAELHQYAYELNRLIEDSSLSSQMKYEVAMDASTIINSSLCWQQ